MTALLDLTALQTPGWQIATYALLAILGGLSGYAIGLGLAAVARRFQ